LLGAEADGSRQRINFLKNTGFAFCGVPAKKFRKQKNKRTLCRVPDQVALDKE
jgi:hypothetical protein